MQNKNIYPPRIATRILLWFLKEELAEEVLGDLEEKYFATIENLSERKADLNYWYQVINYLRPFAIRNNIFSDLNPFFMFNSYFKIAWRSFFKQKLYSFINVTGMTLGMTCFILIALYIQYESSYDLQHEKVDQIYRIAQTQKGNEFRGTDKFALAPITLIPAMKEEFPEVEEGTTLTLDEALFFHEGEALYETGLYADESLFDVFTYPILEGVGKEALKDPDAIILTKSLAEKYFGSSSPIGKSMKFQNERPLIVKGVVADVPDNQHFHFSFITAIKNFSDYEEDVSRWKWGSNNYRAYVVLPKDYDHKQLDEKMKIFDERVKTFYEGAPFFAQYFLQPMKDIHLHSHLNMEAGANGDIRYIYLSISIAFIILLLALFNYMNLAVARTTQRIKEVGTRKVLGARKGQLINQFMVESMLVTFLSFGIAILLAEMLLPTFNQLLGMKISFSLGANRAVLFGLLSIAIILGACAGLYPALLSSAIAPAKALKGSLFKKRKDGAFLRNALVVGQFTAAIVLGICSLVIYQQLQYIQNKKIGYNRDQIIYIPYRSQNVVDQSMTLRNELLKHPQIEKVSIASNLPLNTGNQGIVKEWEGNEENKELWIYRNRVDYDFIDLFEIELLEGRNFSPNYPTDSTESYLLNESAVKALGWTSAVGKSFEDGKVIGVVKDFHFQSFNLSIEPMFMSFINEETSYYAGNIVMKTNMDEPEQTIAHIQKSLKSVMPQIPFQHRFMDESYNQLYQSERQFGAAFNIFTFIALFIACMGLFGLVTLKVLQRTKEIGIRKVLGASVFNIVDLISKDFVKLVVISAILAIPIAWWSMNMWLEDFAYRVDLHWGVFALAGFTAIAIALITISSQSYKAARANPVNSIKTE